MPDNHENEPLSQEALDALMNAVSAAESNLSEDDGVGAAVLDSFPADGFGDGSAFDPAVREDAAADAAPAPGLAYAAMPSPSPSALHMSSFDEPAPPPSNGLSTFGRVQDIPLELTVELGRTRLLIKDILELGAGSIIELEKMAGEPVDLLANGLLIGRGEVVVIEDNFGVRITEIITSADRKTIADDPMTAALNAA